MTDEELTAIKARCAAATPGPWFHGREGMLSMVTASADGMSPFIADDEVARNNATFIAFARTDVPALVAEVERLRSDVARLTAFRDEVLAQRKGE